MRAKRKKVSLQDTDIEDEDASVIKSIKEIKKKLKRIRQLERDSLGI